MSEKSITRLMCGVKKQHGYLQPYMSPAPQGRYVDWDDHLQALGEAEKRWREIKRGDEDRIWEMDEWIQAAAQKLQTITAGVEAEIDRLRPIQAQSGVAEATADRLRQLLDQSETAGAE